MTFSFICEWNQKLDTIIISITDITINVRNLPIDFNPNNWIIVNIDGFSLNCLPTISDNSNYPSVKNKQMWCTVYPPFLKGVNYVNFSVFDNCDDPLHCIRKNNEIYSS